MEKNNNEQIISERAQGFIHKYTLNYEDKT